MSLAKVILSGVVESDPEKRFTPNQNTAVTTFTLWVPALPRQGQNSNAPQADSNSQDGFSMKVTCWRHLAEVIAETVRKGDPVIIEGKLMTSTYQSPEGVAKKGFELEVHSLDKLTALPQTISAPPGSSQSTGNQSGGGNGGRPAQQPQQQNQSPVGVAAASGGNSGFSSDDFMNTEDDIPF